MSELVRYLRCSKIVRETLLPLFAGVMSFEEIMKTIQTKECMNETKKFLSCLYAPNPTCISPKTLLTVPLILEDAEAVLDLDIIHEGKACQANSLAVKSCLQNFVTCNSLTGMRKVLFHLNYSFNEWEERHKVFMLQGIATKRYESTLMLEILCNSQGPLTDNTRILTIKLEKEIEHLEKQASVIGGIVALTEVRNYRPTIGEKQRNEIEQDVSSVCEKAFWDLVSMDLKEETPKAGRVGVILNEIKDEMKTLVPSRKDLHTEWDDYIDGDFIVQQIEHSVYSKEDTRKIFGYLFKQVRQLLSRNDDEEAEGFVKKFDDCLEGADKTSKIYDLIPEGLKFCIHSIYRVKTQLHQLASEEPEEGVSA
jgi:hypothetical protein